MDYEYTFDGIVEIARLIRAYLLWKNRAPKTPLTLTGIDLARGILGVDLTLAHKWVPHYSRPRMLERLRSAGLDPMTWEVIDQRRAAWCWYQLRTTKRYSEKRQETLMASGGEPPPLETPLVFPSARIKRRVLEKEQKKNLNQDFTRKIRERFE